MGHPKIRISGREAITISPLAVVLLLLGGLLFKLEPSPRIGSRMVARGEPFLLDCLILLDTAGWVGMVGGISARLLLSYAAVAMSTNP
jgi:hypothetical protein